MSLGHLPSLTTKSLDMAPNSYSDVELPETLAIHRYRAAKAGE